jgi:chemotaxis protein methyltransferase CheR
VAIPLTTSTGTETLAPPERDLEQLEIELLLEAVYRRYGLDFRQYAQASLKRRLYRRVYAEGLDTLSQLQDRLLHDPPCMERLLVDLSINVTSMFRDPSFYVAFREKVVPALHTYPFTPPARRGPVRQDAHLRNRHQRTRASDGA